MEHHQISDASVCNVQNCFMGDLERKKILTVCLFKTQFILDMFGKCWAGRSTAGIKIAGRNSNNLRYANYITFMAEKHLFLLY